MDETFVSVGDNTAQIELIENFVAAVEKGKAAFVHGTTVGEPLYFYYELSYEPGGRLLTLSGFLDTKKIPPPPQPYCGRKFCTKKAPLRVLLLFAVYMDSGTETLSIVRTFLITVLVAAQREIRANMTSSLSPRTRQAL